MNYQNRQCLSHVITASLARQVKLMNNDNDAIVSERIVAKMTCWSVIQLEQCDNGPSLRFCLSRRSASICAVGGPVL